MVPFAIAGIQMRVSAAESNLAAMTQRVDLLMHRFPWVEMVLFSELCVLGPLRDTAQPLPGPTERAFSALAGRHGIWLIPGSMFERVDDQVYNTAPVINPEGRVIGRYRKMFPFQPYEQGIEPGHEFLVFDVPRVGRFGLSICYDMWFPETSRTLAALGAEVILHPTLTDTIDRDIELSIIRATAAINQCYVFDINGVGDGGYGRSSIVDSAGHVLYSAGAGEEMIPVEIDLERVRREREVGIRGLGQPLKSFRDRRTEFEVYREEAFDNSYLRSLGKLVRPSRGSRAGLAATGFEAESAGAAVGGAHRDRTELASDQDKSSRNRHLAK
jgi:predicted amidohydrolase